MRRLLSLFVLFCLAACDDPAARAPAGASVIPPDLPMRGWPPEGWAWGLIKIGDAPALRYGVAAPPVTPRAQVLILPSYGEPAEAWFEVVDALVAKGDAVWILEAAGQGGSGRYTLPRDVGHAPDFQADLDGLRAMHAVMGRRPTVVIAQGTAAPLLITALRSGLPAQGAILSSPILSVDSQSAYADQIVQAAPWIATAGLGWLRAWDEPSWTRQTPWPPGRAGVIGAWQTANPDLRMAGRSWGWIAAFQDETDAVKAGALGGVRGPVLILQPGARPSAEAAALCKRLPRCNLTLISGGRGALHLESDAALASWTDAVARFVAQANGIE
jgi:lysophospholipase